MNANELTCPKCGGEMRQGFIVDHAGERQIEVSKWVSGPPQTSFWVTAKVAGKPIPVGTFRCGDCGFLEHYARAEFVAR